MVSCHQAKEQNISTSDSISSKIGKIKKEINVIYCPTENMIADYFTKPLQGSQFLKFRDAIMGETHFDSIVKERVGDMAQSE